MQEIKVPNFSVRRHAHLYTPTTLTVPSPSKSELLLSWKMQINTGVKRSLALPTEEGLVFTIQVHIHV